MVVVMSSSPRTVRLPAFVALAAVPVLALAACSGGSDTAATSATTSSATTSTTTSAPTTTTTTPAPTTTSPSSSATPKPTATTSTTPPPSTAFVNSCVSANSKLNAAVSQWNAAVGNGGDAKLDAAAKNYQTVAQELLDLRKPANDRNFTLKVNDVVHQMLAMASARQNNQTVSTTTFNSKVTALRTYCQSRLGS